MLFVMATDLFGVVWPQWRRQRGLLIWSLDTHLTHLLFFYCTALETRSAQETFRKGLETVALMSNHVHTRVNFSLQFNSRQQICCVQMLPGEDKYSGKSQQPVNWKSNRIVRTHRTLTGKSTLTRMQKSCRKFVIVQPSHHNCSNIRQHEQLLQVFRFICSAKKIVSSWKMLKVAAISVCVCVWRKNSDHLLYYILCY